MAGLVPAISIRMARHCLPKRDRRDKPGDDDGEGIGTGSNSMSREDLKHGERDLEDDQHDDDLLEPV
jgi:hypothetical protein